MKLYIVGNGFDLHHKLKTNYSDYRDFLMLKDSNIVNAYESFDFFLFDQEEKEKLWNKLEKTLYFDYEECAYEIIENFYPSLADDSDSKWQEMEVECIIKTGFADKFIGEYFYEWISKENERNISGDLEFEKNSLFLNFNYTNTLQRVYNINSTRILHIHGEINNLNNNENLQFGSIENSSKQCKEDLVRNYETDDFYGASIEAAVIKLVEFTERTSKSIQANYKKLSEFISKYKIEEIVIMGHSISGSEYDDGYYEDVIIPLVGNVIPWKMYWYSEEDKENILSFIEKYGIENYEFIEW